MKYRIVTDRFGGFECQGRYFWFPFWFELDHINTSTSLEEAEKWLKNYIKVKNFKSIVIKKY